MEKIFHVFVSSTYSDLIEERKKVSEAVAKAGYVAEGMEIFPASSQKQMSFIERVIDRCDYYILILAGRYGSLAEDGLSYTEKEFLHAKSMGIPVLAFIRNDLENLPINKIEEDLENKQRLSTFIDSLKNESMVDFWANPDELSTKALAALSQARVTFEGVGWIRADTAASNEILNDINNLRKENEELRSIISAAKQPPIFDNINLAGLDEEFIIHFESKPRVGGSNVRKTPRTSSMTWRAILAAIGPQFRTPSNTSGISSSLDSVLRKVANLSAETNITIDMADKQRILMQMEALGMMRAATYNLKNGGHEVFHQLTNQGLAHMLRENVVKSADDAAIALE
ncbi:DUF4062 domain-containing protein [Breoghania sp.]|uniref:DUF4062 domain-containing protein n=1 Tax=Breoghania sp. TaxID=2065378 RepID=UPI002AAC255D|nr:DUF4062 domain-containing protein [Breoghania sp.]